MEYFLNVNPYNSISSIIFDRTAMWWRNTRFHNVWKRLHVWSRRGASSRAMVIFLSLSMESEWGCVYPTFTLKISSSDAADIGSFRPLSISSSTFRSPEMALRISGPISCNVRRPACRGNQSQQSNFLTIFQRSMHSFVFTPMLHLCYNFQHVLLFSWQSLIKFCMILIPAERGQFLEAPWPLDLVLSFS